MADLSRPELSLHWDEAVAVVAEVAAVLSARGLSSVPASESIVLTAEGTLRLLDEGPLHAVAAQGTPTQRLGTMLALVLSSVACPPELRQLVVHSMADPPAYATVEAFAEALAFFERPARHDLLKAVAARASEGALQARAHVELERLQTRARNLPDTANIRSGKALSHVRRVVLLVAAAVVVLSALVGAVLALLAANPAGATITERVRARVEGIAQKGLEAIGVRTPDALPAAAVETPAPVAPKPVKRTPRELPLTISVRAIEGRSIPALSSFATPEPRDLVVSDETIYAAGEDGIEPAVLMRPQLPSQPPSTVPAQDVGVLEIVVSATGAVEHVRLISTANRYHDRMIVAAAKAWSFEPATKDGRPVRYRARIRVTL
jgi:TonB family protein